MYRLCRRSHADLTGAGGLAVTGRWHDRLAPIIYAASSRALSMLEVLVHMEVDYDDLPDDYVFQVIDAPDQAVDTIQPDDLKLGGVLGSKPACREYGSRWLAEQRSLLLMAPSIIIDREPNIMINPAHPQAIVLQTRIEDAVRWDCRLF